MAISASVAFVTCDRALTNKNELTNIESQTLARIDDGLKTSCATQRWQGARHAVL